jgi:hypothetical protein
MNKVTKQTDSAGFYLLEDGSASIYNKSGYTPKDVHELNMEAKEAEKERG